MAGPYRADTIYGVAQNIQKARDVALRLWKLGYAAICPHSNTAFLMVHVMTAFGFQVIWKS